MLLLLFIHVCGYVFLFNIFVQIKLHFLYQVLVNFGVPIFPSGGIVEGAARDLPEGRKQAVKVAGTIMK